MPPILEVFAAIFAIPILFGLALAVADGGFDRTRGMF
jgi:hypothetical protein